MKENYIYGIVFLISFLIMIITILNDYGIIDNILSIIFEGKINDVYVDIWFGNSTDPTRLNRFVALLKQIPNMLWQLDELIIFGTALFQLIIPLFAVISGVKMYKYYNTLFRMNLNKRKSFRSVFIIEVIKNSIKLSLSIFLAYLTFVFIVNIISTKGYEISETRDFLLDIFGKALYEKRVFYYMIEGFVRFFFVPFIYSFFIQIFVLIVQNLKTLIAIPLVYYYGLSTIGYACYSLIPRLSLYINPTVIMANGSYANINSFILLFMNSIPIFIAIVVFIWKTRYVEI